VNRRWQSVCNAGMRIGDELVEVDQQAGEIVGKSSGADRFQSGR
jgi:hypothetical protein